ncbi:MAG: SAM-dependent methyltransferase [Clostridia bacterium]|nr:SAM-dependent methyltransferase [Clostridia bacterium]
MITDDNKKKLRLNPRLLKIAQLIPDCKSLADIGTDHAYVPIFALLEGKVSSAIASDINRGPVQRAKENAKAFGLEDKLSLRLGPGLETVKPNEAETIIVAGMGGILISEILENSKEVVKSAKHLILQPMTAAKELREYLIGHSFTIQKEVLVSEDDKIYNILCVDVGGRSEYSQKELILGKGLEDTAPELYSRYFKNIERKLKIRIAGLKSSGLKENQDLAKEAEALLDLINS